MSISLRLTNIGQQKDMVLRHDTASYSKSLKVQDTLLYANPKHHIGTGKTGYTRTRNAATRTRPDPKHVYPTRTRPAGTGRVRVNPRVRVYPQTPSPHRKLRYLCPDHETTARQHRKQPDDGFRGRGSRT